MAALQVATIKEDPSVATEKEHIVLAFSNGHGGTYRWNLSHENEKASLAAAAKLQQKLVGIEIAKPDDQEGKWQAKGEPQYRQTKAKSTRKNTTNTTKETTASVLFEVVLDPELKEKAESAEAKRKNQHNWLFTPGNVELWRHETLVKKLKAAYQENHDGDTFLAYLRMLLAIYNCDFLDLDKKVAAGDFYDEVREIYDLKQQWSYQMMAALPELGFMFSRDEFTRLKKRLASQKHQQTKEVLTKTEDVDLINQPAAAVTPTASFTQEAEAEDKAAPPQPTKKTGMTKKEKNLLKKFNQKGSQPKKKRGFFF